MERQLKKKYYKRKKASKQEKETPPDLSFLLLSEMHLCDLVCLLNLDPFAPTSVLFPLFLYSSVLLLLSGLELVERHYTNKTSSSSYSSTFKQFEEEIEILRETRPWMIYIRWCCRCRLPQYHKLISQTTELSTKLWVLCVCSQCLSLTRDKTTRARREALTSSSLVTGDRIWRNSLRGTSVYLPDHYLEIDNNKKRFDTNIHARALRKKKL